MNKKRACFVAVFLVLLLIAAAPVSAVDPTTLRYCDGRLSSSPTVPDQPISFDLYY